MGFMPYKGDLMGLPTNENYLNFKWENPDCKVLFSVARQGKAVTCHLASDKKGLRKLHQAIEEWCEFVFDLLPWCEMIFAKIYHKRRSIIKLAQKCGFVFLYSVMNGTIDIYVRVREV